MSSITVSLTGTTSELTANFFPEIVLDEKYEYSCGLLDFTTYQSTPNISKSNNTFHFDGGVIEIPIGSYEVVEVLDYIKMKLQDFGISFDYKVNKNTFKTTVKCSAKILLGLPNSIHTVLGFRGGVGEEIPANFEHESEEAIRISKLNVIRIECNIISGAYVNGKLCHAIYEFASNKVDIGYKIIEQPQNIIYLPVIPRRISSIQISVVDQNGDLIDFRGEDITCRIHIKRNDK